MKKKTKKNNYAAGITFTIGAIFIWILNFFATEGERLYIELFFITIYIPTLLMYLKYYFCKEKKRVTALRRKIGRDKRKKRKRIRV